MQHLPQATVHLGLILLSESLDRARVEAPGTRVGLLDAQFVTLAVVKSSVDFSPLTTT